MNQRFGFPLRFDAGRVRPLLALALVQVMLLGLAPSGGGATTASARSVAKTQAAKKSPQWVADETGGVFIIQQGADGSTCRVALPEEARRLRSTPREGLRQINHLDGKLNANGSLAIGDDPAAAAANLTIILRATTQLQQQPNSAQVIAAFTAAAAKWETLIKDPITIVIDVDFGPTAFGQPFPSDNTLGATNTQGLFINDNYPNVRQRLINRAENSEETSIYNALPTGSLPTDLGNVTTVVIQSPLLRALGFLGPDARNDGGSVPGDPPSIAFNSAFPFDFDPSDGINGNRTDFDAVAVHEIGHALGFDSNVGLREVAPNAPLHVALWDIFRFRPATGSNNFTNSNRILTTGGTQVHFDGG